MEDLMEHSQDRFGLQRFAIAQDKVIDQVLRELGAGAKQSHWMWFIFPQLTGLGSSAMAQRYAIGSVQEALAYLAHPILGDRLLNCTKLVNAINGRSAYEVFGSPDDLKFRSSMTLFHAAAPALPDFAEALARYFAGQGDPLTIRKLQAP
jgi:uncharacterized protein (DUF1810 family)